MTDPDIKIIPKSAWTVLIPPGCCEVCGIGHEPEWPHNPDSLTWQTKREIAGEPMPTWKDALAHCSPEMREMWVRELAKAGVVVDE